MARPTNLRNLIIRDRDNLEAFGTVHPVRAPFETAPGREVTGVYRNEGN